MVKSINVLGTRYQIRCRSKAQDKMLESCDGYCDKTTKLIVVATRASDCELDDFGVYQKSCLRHELLHAFLFESGLHQNFEHPRFGHDETYLDWFATQSPKIFRAYQEAECL